MKRKVKNSVWLEAIELLRKVIRYSRGGLTKEERWEIAHDFVSFGALLLKEIVEEDDAKD
jgi:hypothetical protein|tara:strand:- start:268 stop:447 length:180 start_codon:yes stop_codon:yes gene_type:complete